MYGGGLSGLIAHINDKILVDKDEITDEIINEIVSKYPLSKSCIKYLFTLYQELELNVSELQEENKRLKSEIKRLEQRKVLSSSKDSQEDKNRLLSFLNEQKEYIQELEQEKERLEKENYDLRQKLVIYEDFFSSSFLGAMLYKSFLKRYGNV
jgi:DNA-binding MarR family transcriptional regulator